MKRLKKMISILLCAGLTAMIAGGGIFYVRKSTAYRQTPIQAYDPEPMSTFLEVPNREKLRLYAAKGLSATAPENTLESIRAAGERGFHHIQLDVGQTKDGVPVLFWDRTLERMTAQSRRLSAITAEKLSEIPLDNGANIERYKEVYVPLLHRALQECAQYEMAVLLQIRSIRDLEKLQAELKDSPVPYALISPDKGILKQLKKAGEKNLIYAVDAVTKEGVQYAKERGYGLLFRVSAEEKEDDFLRKTAGEIPLYVAGVSDRTTLGRMARLGIRNILTDRILPIKMVEKGSKSEKI